MRAWIPQKVGHTLSSAVHGLIVNCSKSQLFLSFISNTLSQFDLLEGNTSDLWEVSYPTRNYEGRICISPKLVSFQWTSSKKDPFWTFWLSTDYLLVLDIQDVCGLNCFGSSLRMADDASDCNTVISSTVTPKGFRLPYMFPTPSIHCFSPESRCPLECLENWRLKGERLSTSFLLLVLSRQRNSTLSFSHYL